MSEKEINVIEWLTTMLILLAGHIPAFKTALTTDEYLSYVDITSIFTGWAFGMLSVELFTGYKFRKELERKTKGK